jgi:hypothetical protein
MTIFEQYWENVPLYIPDDEFLIDLWQKEPRGVLSELSMYQVLGLPTDQLPADDPNGVHNDGVVRWWVERSDYGSERELSEIVQFSSFEHLSDLLASQDDWAISERMRDSNVVRRNAIVPAWAQALDWLRART